MSESGPSTARNYPDESAQSPSDRITGAAAGRRRPARFWYGVAAVLFVAFCLYNVWIESQAGSQIAPRTQCLNNIHNITLALQNYHFTYGSFPPAYIPDKNGRPMHSWRVLLLPYLDRSDLYDAYRFDEPWDGPNNRKLHSVSLDIFHCPADERGKNGAALPMTSYLAIVGPGAAWSGAEPSRLADVTDDPSYTLMVVEVANSGIHWMEPRDLYLAQMAPTINAKSGQGISSRHRGGAIVGMVDARARFLPEDLSAAKIQALLTIRGGEQISP